MWLSAVCGWCVGCGCRMALRESTNNLQCGELRENKTALTLDEKISAAMARTQQKMADLKSHASQNLPPRKDGPANEAPKQPFEKQMAPAVAESSGKQAAPMKGCTICLEWNRRGRSQNALRFNKSRFNKLLLHASNRLQMVREHVWASKSKHCTHVIIRYEANASK